MASARLRPILLGLFSTTVDDPANREAARLLAFLDEPRAVGADPGTSGQRLGSQGPDPRRLLPPRHEAGLDRRLEAAALVLVSDSQHVGGRIQLPGLPRQDDPGTDRPARSAGKRALSRSRRALPVPDRRPGPNDPPGFGSGADPGSHVALRTATVERESRHAVEPPAHRSSRNWEAAPARRPSPRCATCTGATSGSRRDRPSTGGPSGRGKPGDPGGRARFP